MESLLIEELLYEDDSSRTKYSQSITLAVKRMYIYNS